MKSGIRIRLAAWVLVAALLPLAARAQGIAYDVALQGIADPGLAGQVDETSRLVGLKDDKPSSLVSLRRRAEADMERIQEVLRAEGYYAAKVDFAMAEDQDPVKVTITADPGPHFKLLSFDVLTGTPAGMPPPQPVPLADLGIIIGEAARAKAVVDAQAALLRHLAEQGYPLAHVDERKAVVDHAAQSMRVELNVSTGPLCRFGPVRIGGLGRLDEEWVRNRLPWHEGERFSVTQMELLRKRLVESRLFASVKLATAKEAEPDGTLPITVDLREAQPRSIGIGTTWSSSEGFGADAFWEYRNIFGDAERLRTSLMASEIRNAADVQFRLPDMHSANQDFISSAMIEEQRTDAFITRTAGASAGLERMLTPDWRVSASTSVERTFEERETHTRSFTLVSFPLEARHDNTDDQLDPTQGNRMRAQVRPFVDSLGGTVGFTRLELNDSHYLLMLNNPRIVLAGWGRLGFIGGAGLEEVPADKRFFVGGGGSVRAYGFQKAGPLDEAGDPLGGLSALAFGGEARVKITDTIGVVPFLEAGNAYETRWPRPWQSLRWGAGLGLRYHTPIGPVRGDVAVPLNRRPGIDDSFQIYLSLGQAF